MGRIKDIDADMHELPDFEKGIQAERERIATLLETITDKYRWSKNPDYTLLNVDLLFADLGIQTTNKSEGIR